MTTGITLTRAAADHVGGFLARRGKGLGLRLGIRTTGCSGLAYRIEFADDIEEGDREFASNGIRVFVDPKSLPYIEGTEVDFVKDGLNEGFRFNNPNVKSECGCGESFNV
ncbi:MAG: iron-sulfur cluster assembly protein IscA [Burkholderiaceae bacterium]|jgi:iron-sulfur cluster assembly protein|nr:iron-sulfur cluster assembly protein IscA [Burkholderiaceae bacterium]MEB2319394.1 iron-sulfur cluster assembly protein IscA [Pseudomonadota bacterium]